MSPPLQYFSCLEVSIIRLNINLHIDQSLSPLPTPTTPSIKVKGMRYLPYFLLHQLGTFIILIKYNRQDEYREVHKLRGEFIKSIYRFLFNQKFLQVHRW